MGQNEEAEYYPHARANVETRGEAVFAARNAIDPLKSQEKFHQKIQMLLVSTNYHEENPLWYTKRSDRLKPLFQILK